MDPVVGSLQRPGHDFQISEKKIDDDGLDDDVLPATTNAQESLHRVYYMIS